MLCASHDGFFIGKVIPLITFNHSGCHKRTQIQDMKSYITAAALLVMSLPAVAKTGSDPAMDKFIDDLMGRMTLKERIGQLNLGVQNLSVSIKTPSHCRVLSSIY